MNHVRTSVLLALLAVCASPTNPLAASGAPAEIISGHVTDAAGGWSISDVIVQLYDGSGELVAAAVTNASGRFAFDTLPDGTYYARTFADFNHVDELYDDIPCSPACAVNTGTPIVVTSGGPPQTIDFALGIRQGHRIAGTIRSAAGAPLTGISVWLLDVGGGFVGAGGTGFDGTYVTSPVPPGAYYVRTFNTSGYFDEVYDDRPCSSSSTCDLAGAQLVTVATGTITEGIDFALDTGGRIAGRITTVTGEPLPNAYVNIVDAAGRYVSAAWTQADGTYLSGAVPEGDYWVRTVNYSGYLDEAYDDVACVAGRCALDAGAMVHVAGATTTLGIDFALARGGRITGTVRAAVSNDPLPNIGLEIMDADGFYLTSAWTDFQGGFSTTGLLNGTYYVRTRNEHGYKDQLYAALSCVASKCSALSGTPVPITVPNTSGNVDFALIKGAELTGVVLDAATGYGVSSFFVSVFDGNGQFMTSSWTDGAGRYTTTGLEAGTYYARTSNQRGYRSQLFDGLSCAIGCAVTFGTPISVSDPERRAGVNFALFPGATISGVITGAGAAVEGVTVTAYTPDGFWVASGSTNAAGEYSITGLDEGSYRVRTFNDAGFIDQLYAGIACPACDIATGTPVAVTAAGVTAGINFDLALGGRITGQVTAGPGGPGLADVSVQVYQLVAVPVGPPAVQFVRSAETDAFGQYTVVGLAAGNYVATTRNTIGYVDQLYNNRTCLSFCYPGVGDPIAVTAGATTPNVNFPLALGATITGRVTGAADGLPIPGAFVQAWRVVAAPTGTLTEFAGSAPTDASGAYVFSGLPAGTYYTQTYNTLGYINELYNDIACVNCVVTNGMPIMVAAGATVPNIDFALAMGGKVSGRVTAAATGIGLAGVNVIVFTVNPAPPGPPPPASTFFVSALTGADGNYIVNGLPEGTYYAHTANAGLYINEIHEDIACFIGCPQIAGTPIAVTLGATTPNIDFGLTLGGRITGQVTDAQTLAPLPGVFVQLHLPNNTSAILIADATGRYNLQGLPTGTYFARTIGNPGDTVGYLDQLYDHKACGIGCLITEGTPIAVAAGVTSANIDFALTIGGKITGRVRDAATGTGLAGVNVEVYTVNPVPPGPIPPAPTFFTSVVTDANGDYTVKGLPQATYFARTSNAGAYINEIYDNIGCIVFCAQSAGTPIPVTVGATTPNIDFGLTLGGRITGQVTANGGAGLPFVSVFVYRSADAPPGGIQILAGVTTDVTGHYTVQGLPGGTYYVATGFAPGYVNEIYDNIPCLGFCSLTPGVGTPIFVAAGATVANINFSLAAAGSVTGRVTDAATATPIGSVFVQVYTAGGAFASSAFTTPTGDYVVQGLPPGSYYAVTNAPGYIPQLYNNISCLGCAVTLGTPITVNAGATTTNINFALVTPGRITGRVTSAATGLPASGVFVQAYAAPSGSFITSAQTDGTGVYTLTGLATGTYFVRTFNSSGLLDELYNDLPCTGFCNVTAGTPIVVTAGATAIGIDFALGNTPRITGRVTNAATTAPVAAVVVQIYNESGSFVSSGFSDASGNYGSGVLTPGTYYARTSNAPGFLDQLYSGQSCVPGCTVTHGTPIVVQAGQATAGVNFAMAPSARIAGSVRSTAGNFPIPASVQIYDADGFFVTAVFTDASGNYAASGNMLTGSYYVRTSNGANFVDEVFDNVPCVACDVTSGTPVTATVGLTTSEVNFRLDIGGRISGRVTSPAQLFNLFGINVQVFDSAGLLVTTAPTDGSGNYSTRTGLPTGQYYARTSNNFHGLRDTLYDGIPCPFGSCSPTSGAPINVTAGMTTSSIDFVLPLLGRISGIVRDGATNLPLLNAVVQIYSSTGVLMGTSFGTGPNGYTVAGLTAGTYYALASRQGYKREAYNDLPFLCIGGCGASGTPIVVGDGAEVTGIDFGLFVGGRIAGRVTDANTHAGLAGVIVEIYDHLDILVSRASSDGSGNYVSDAGLPDGNYYLRTRNARGYIDRLFNALPCVSCAPSSGTPIAVVNNITTPNVNVELLPGGRIAGTVTSNGRPINAGFQIASVAPQFAGDVLEDAGAFVTSVPTDGSGNYTGGTFVTVNVFDSTGAFVTSGAGDASGNYVTKAGLPDGNYFAVTATNAGFFNEAFDDILCAFGCDPTAGTPVAIALGQQASSVNFDLRRGGRIAGAVKDIVTGLPLRGIWVDIYDAANQLVATAVSTNSGVYTTHQGLETGTYYARTRDVPGYRSERFNDLLCVPGNCVPGGGTAIPVTSPSTTPGVDFALTPGVSQQVPVITWANPADIRYPTALSAAQLNATSNGVAGTFAYSPNFGETLPVGNGQVLTVTFTPSDPGTYAPATAAVTINVLPPIATVGVSLVGPNGGEKFFAGAPATASWTVSGVGPGRPSSIDVALSTDGGTTFTNIPGCTGMPGIAMFCFWTPTAPTATARIRVTAHQSGGPDVSDTSNANFTIAAQPSITVQGPNTAVIWAIGATNEITWSHTLGPESFVKVELSRNGGLSWETLAASVANSLPDSGSMSWVVSGPASAAAIVRVTSLDTPASDVSDVAFSIAAVNLAVTAPNTAVTWRAGTVHNVTVTHDLGAGQTLDVLLSRDGGATWSPIGTIPTTATGGKYVWTVAGPQTTRALVRVVWVGHPEISDQSDVEFVITPRIIVKTPNTAVSWAAGSTRQITWTHNLAATDTVDVDASTDGGATWTRLASAVANATATTGSYTGPMPSTVTTQALIRVSQTGAPNEFDTSDVPFTLAAPALSVTAPLTNVRWLIGELRTIRWSHNLGDAESVKVELSRNGGGTWEVLAASVQNAAVTSGRLDWTVTGPVTSAAVVRVTWTTGTMVSALSPVPFRIQ